MISCYEGFSSAGESHDEDKWALSHSVSRRPSGCFDVLLVSCRRIVGAVGCRAGDARSGCCNGLPGDIAGLRGSLPP